MPKKGKFLLFSVDEFDRWLEDTCFSRSVKLIQNHHTYLPSYANFTSSNHFALLEGMDRYHVTASGCSEIAQNLTSFPDGSIAVCRAFDKIPAGIKGANQEGLCIEHIGNFDAGHDAMSAPHRETIIRMNALLCREYGLTPSTNTIVYHHWYDLITCRRTNGTGKTKTCPGTAFFGGNTVQSANSNFIPLVAGALAGMAGGTADRAPASFRTAEVAASSLNIRSGCGTQFSIVKSLNRGVVVKVFEVSDGWCRIHPVEEQWVSSRYLRFAA